MVAKYGYEIRNSSLQKRQTAKLYAELKIFGANNLVSVFNKCIPNVWYRFLLHCVVQLYVVTVELVK